MRSLQDKVKMTDKFHCIECAGKARDYDCATCDGKGNPKEVVKSSKKKTK